MKLLLLLFASSCLLASCASRDEEFAAAIDKLQIDQQLQEIRLSLAEDQLVKHKIRIDGLQTTLERMLHPLPENESVPGAKAAQNLGQTRTGTSSSTQSKPAQTSSKAKSPERQAYDRALTTLLNGNPKTAEPMFTEFLGKYPSSSLAPNAEYWLGEAFYGQGRFGEAILAFQNVAALHPKHNKAPAALLKTGFSYERLSDRQNAVFYLEQLLEAYPNSEPAPQARKALQRLRQTS